MSDSEAVKDARALGSVAAKLAVMVLAAYQRDEAAAMQAFGSNAAGHVANDLSRELMRFKIKYPPAPPEGHPVD